MQRLVQSCHAYLIGGTIAVLGSTVLTQPASAQFFQQSEPGGSGAVGAAELGSSVALSADGNTAIVGAPDDN
jgi:hypothetical protein